MEVPASAATTRDTKISKWQFDTSPEGTIEMTGFDSHGAVLFSGTALLPKDGIHEYHFLGGVLRVNEAGEVMQMTLGEKAIDLANRMHTDTEAYLKQAEVPLSACSQAVDYYNACAIAAAVAAAACVAAPTPPTCAAMVVALNFEAQARSAMNEVCGSDGCGDRCTAPFTCDTNTGNCTCVSSCSGPLCGGTDACGNACPTLDDTCGPSDSGYTNACGRYCPPTCAWYDCNGACNGPATYDSCGVCGGDGSSCYCPYVDCFGDCWGAGYRDDCGNCIYGGDPYNCQNAG